jgi:hypothetical protein
MLSKWLNLCILAGVGAVLLLLAAAIAVTWFKRRQEISSVSDEQKIARTLEIIRTSTPKNHKVLKVLFYGQSITRGGWHNAVVAHWHEKYPNTVFVVQNRALGGFAAQFLVRTTEQDIAAFYPDLIIFHVYGDHRAYEKILRMFHSLTAADVILQTDHGEVLPDPPCAEGLQLSWHQMPGCAGTLWVHQDSWHDEMSYHKIPAFGNKYGMAVEPQHTWWRDYLLQRHLDARSLVMDDGVHPNEKGNQLIADFFNRYFDDLVDHWNGEKEQNVISIPFDAVEGSNGMQSVTFEGSRLELLSTQPVAVWPSVKIDGQSPKDLDGCYQVTRSSPLTSVPDWPAVRRITLLHDRTPADWTATITSISQDESHIDFKVRTSVTGDEGGGSSSGEYVSKSRQLSIDGDDWMFQRGYDLKHVPLQVPAEVHWSVQYICGGTPEVIDRGNGTTEYRYLLGAGLVNGVHTVKMSLGANDLVAATELRAYRPPMR